MSSDAHPKWLESHYEAVLLFLKLNFIDLCLQFK